MGNKQPPRLGEALKIALACATARSIGTPTPSEKPRPIVLSDRPEDDRPTLHEPQIARDLGLTTVGVMEAILRCLNDEAAWPLTLLGPVGLGKTLGALSFLDVVASDTMYWSSFARFCEEVDMAREGTLTAKGDAGTLYYTARSFWRHVRGCSVAVLDEIGMRDRVTGPQYEKMVQFLDCRPAPAAPTVLISNLSLRDLASIYDDRVASRLAAGTVVRLEGADRRRERRGAPHATARDG